MFLKKCIQCGRELTLDNFYKSKATKDGYRPQCKDCCKTNNTEYYNKHKDERIDYQKKYTINNIDKVKEFQGKYYEEHREDLKKYYKQRTSEKRKFIDSLKTPCVKCGEDRLYLIEFHHIDPSEKCFTISDRARNKSDMLKAEINKCVCLCRNCHGEFHHFYGVRPHNPKQALGEYLQ